MNARYFAREKQMRPLRGEGNRDSEETDTLRLKRVPEINAAERKKVNGTLKLHIRKHENYRVAEDKQAQDRKTKPKKEKHLTLICYARTDRGK